MGYHNTNSFLTGFGDRTSAFSNNESTYLKGSHRHHYGISKSQKTIAPII